MGTAGMESVSMYDALVERVGESKLRYASA
jgi:hypothetical protein